MQPMVSVIIPTRNSGKFLEVCLESIRDQSYKLHEVIVVDCFSTDSTVKIAADWGARVVRDAGTQASARNRGIREAKGDYILFLDSDQAAESETFKECLDLCINKGVGAVKIPELFMGHDFWGASSALWRNSAASVEEAIPRFYKREALLEAGLFRDNLKLWEDLELYQRVKIIGVKDGWCKARIYHHESPRLLDMLRKTLSYGKSIVVYNRETTSKPQKEKIKMFTFTINKMIALSDSSKLTLGCLFLVSLKGICILLGIISGHLTNNARDQRK